MNDTERTESLRQLLSGMARQALAAEDREPGLPSLALTEQAIRDDQPQEAQAAVPDEESLYSLLDWLDGQLGGRLRERSAGA